MFIPSRQNIKDAKLMEDYHNIYDLINTRNHFQLMIDYANGDRNPDLMEKYNSIIGLDGIDGEKIAKIESRIDEINKKIDESVINVSIAGGTPLITSENIYEMVSVTLKNQEKIRQEKIEANKERIANEIDNPHTSTNTKEIVIAICLLILLGVTYLRV